MKAVKHLVGLGLTSLALAAGSLHAADLRVGFGLDLGRAGDFL